MATSFDNSWLALSKPGKAQKYFDLDTPSNMSLEDKSYNKINAWWLAEFSRLIYRQEQDELGQYADGLTRQAVLQQVGFQELHFFNNKSTQCAVFAPQDGTFAVLVFRGTHDAYNWLLNLNTWPATWQKGGSVHSGFKSSFDAVWQVVENYLDSLQVPVYYTGHSLGGAMAVLAASSRPPYALYTFGCPRVGNSAFTETLQGFPHYRIVNHCDVFTTVPARFLNFAHTGKLIYIASNNQFLFNPSDELIKSDRKRVDPNLSETTNFRHWYDPAEFLADHAPVNYVAHLERRL